MESCQPNKRLKEEEMEQKKRKEEEEKKKKKKKDEEEKKKKRKKKNEEEEKEEEREQDQKQEQKEQEEEYMRQCTNPGSLASRATRFLLWLLTFCGPPLINLLHVTVMTARILRWVLDIRKICATLSTVTQIYPLQQKETNVM
jgi:uncharacterized membrane protein YdbT with pleckstrin-like domain